MSNPDSKARHPATAKIWPIAKARLASKDKVTLFEFALKQFEGKCPSCGKKWPEKIHKQVLEGARIPQDIHKKLNQLDKPSTYLSAVIHTVLDLCTVCGGDSG